MPAFVVLGVSGVGKSTVGALAAARLDCPFIEADEYHPPANVAKMSCGVPLTNADRAPWIDRLAQAVNAMPPGDIVVACSALTRFVRRRLRTQVERPVSFIYLTAPAALIQQRIQARPRHFMKPGMLDSQLAALEPPGRAVTVDASLPTTQVVEAVVRYMQAGRF